MLERCTFQRGEGQAALRAAFNSLPDFVQD